MGLAPEFQPSEVGPIPLDWEYVRLTTVARLESGHTPSRRNPAYWDGEIPWISLADTAALDAREIFRTQQTIGPLGLANSSARLLPKGTVVFSRTATIGKTCIMGREMATSQDFANYVCGPRIHNLFLVYFFRSMKSRWKQLMAGSAHNTIYMPVFERLQVPLPPLAEQEAIARVLSDAGALVESLARLIAKKRLIKQGAMQELLTGKRRLPGFENEPGWKQTEIGPIPEDWILRRVGEMGTVLAGKALDATGPGERRPYLRTKNVFDGRISLEDVLTMPFTDAEFERFRLRHGDVLLNEGQSLDLVGRCSMYRGEHPEPCAIQNQLLRFRAYPNTSSEFAAHLFRNCQKNGSFSLIATQTTSVAHLGVSRFSNLLLAWPADVQEQMAIGAALCDMDAELDALEAKLEKARQLEQGMMHNLLTGKIRLS